MLLQIIEKMEKLFFTPIRREIMENRFLLGQLHIGHAIFGKQPQLECWVVATEEGLIGYTSFMMQFSTWDAAYYLYMDCLFLRPEARSLGIGVVLMENLRQLAFERGCMNIQWQTPSFNDGAVRFYERLGAVAKVKQRFIWSTQ